MAKVSRHRVNARKQAKRLGLTARRAWVLSLRRKDEHLIPTYALRALQAAALPPDVGAYNTRLHDLLRG